MLLFQLLSLHAICVPPRPRPAVACPTAGRRRRRSPLFHFESWNQTRSESQRSDRRRIERPRLAALQSRPSSSRMQKKGVSC